MGTILVMSLVIGGLSAVLFLLVLAMLGMDSEIDRLLAKVKERDELIRRQNYMLGNSETVLREQFRVDTRV